MTLIFLKVYKFDVFIKFVLIINNILLILNNKLLRIYIYIYIRNNVLMYTLN